MARIVIAMLVSSLLHIVSDVDAQINLDEASQRQMLMTSLSSMPLSFVENRGQFGDETLFKAEAGGVTFLLSKDEVVYVFVRDTGELVEEDIIPFSNMVDLHDKLYQPRHKKEILLIKAGFVDANPDADVVGVDQLSHYSNYFIGNDPSKWRTRVPNFAAVKIDDIYPGIDLKYYGDSGSLKYDLMVRAGAEVSQIKIRYEGAENLSVTPSGHLEIETSFGVIREENPHIYQEIGGRKHVLSGNYEMKEPGVFGFKIDGGYDNSYPVIIDPILGFSNYYGERLEDWSYSVALNPFPPYYVYIAGHTWSMGAGNSDLFICKLDPSGSQIIEDETWTTYIIGNDDDWGYGIVIDAGGYAYVGGRTYSEDFPTPNGYQQTTGGYWDAFVAKLNPDGRDLSYGTFLGGSSYDACHNITVDANGCAYVTGMTYSDDFPSTDGCHQESTDGYWDVFVSKFSSSGETLLYSTYLGGSYIETAYGIALDEWNNAFITGWTWSEDFDITDVSYQDTLNGHQDAFISKLSPGGDGLIFSTFLGGEAEDYGKDIALDGSNYIYITGWTKSQQFPCVNADDDSPNGLVDAFVSKLIPDGNGLSYSTYLGGENDDCGYGIAIDNYSDHAFITGRTESVDNFPRRGHIYLDYSGLCDAFLSEFDSSGSLTYSTYYGGTRDDWGYDVGLYSLPFDLGQGIYLTGKTASDDLPNSNDYISSFSGHYDAFVSMFVTTDLVSFIAVIDSIMPDSADTSETVTFGGHGVRDPDNVPFATYEWSSDIDGILSDSPSFSTTDLSIGTHAIRFRIQDAIFVWSEDAIGTVEITAVDNPPPIAFIDSIIPNPADSGNMVFFWGHGEDPLDDDIIDWNWRSDINGYLSDQPQCSTNACSTGTHTIYFEVMDSDSSWSNEVSEKLHIIKSYEEKWETSWWYPEFGDTLDVLMNQFYSCTLFVTNTGQKDQIFDFGLDASFLFWDSQGDTTDPDWDDLESPCWLYGSDYLFGYVLTDPFAADETKEYVFRTRNQWYWIEPWTWWRILPIIVQFVPIPQLAVSEAITLIVALHAILEEQNAPVILDCDYSLMEDATSNIQAKTDSVWVRPEQITFYWLSVVYGIIGSQFTTAGYLAWGMLPAGPAIASALFVAEAIMFVISERYYVMAYEIPDEIGPYDNYAHPPKLEDIDAYGVVRDSIEEGCLKNIDYKALELYSISEAAGSSYERCVGALKADSPEWAAKQLAATYCYTKQQSSILQEINEATYCFIDNFDTPDSSDVDAAIDSLEDGLPDIEVQIMDSLGFDPAGIAEEFLDAYDSAGEPHICSSFVKLPSTLDTLGTSLIALISDLCNYGIGEALIGDPVHLSPAIVVNDGDVPMCTLWVEIPALEVPLTDIEISALVCDRANHPIGYFGITDDYDEDQLPEVKLVFPPVTEVDGKRLQSIFGNVIIIASQDTIPFSTAALLTVYDYVITSALCGEVRESEDFEDLEGVNVSIYLDSLYMYPIYSAFTDAEGTFCFYLEDNTYYAEFKKPSYCDERLGPLEVAPNETTKVCIIMRAVAQDIPTLSEWGMIILGLMVLAVGTVAVMRRRQTAPSKVA